MMNVSIWKNRVAASPRHRKYFIQNRVDPLSSLLNTHLQCQSCAHCIINNRLDSTSVVWCSSISGLSEKSTFYLQQKYPTKAVIWSQSSSRPKSLYPLTSLNIASPSPKLSPGIASKRSSVSASWSPPLQEKDLHMLGCYKKSCFLISTFIYNKLQ